MDAKDMPPVGFGIWEFEILAGLPRRTGYAKAKNGDVRTFTGLDGKLKVHPAEAYRFMQTRGE